MSIFQFIKGLINSGSNDDSALFSTLAEKMRSEVQRKDNYFWSIKATDSQVYQTEICTLADEKKVGMMLYAISFQYQFYKERNSYRSDDKNYQKCSIVNAILRQLMRGKIVLNADHVDSLTHAFINFNALNNFLYWPISSFITQIQKNFSGKELPELVRASLFKLRDKLVTVNDYYNQKEKVKLLEKIEGILFESHNKGTKVKPVYFPVEDRFAQFANDMLSTMQSDVQVQWFGLMTLAQKNAGSKPSQKFLDTAKELFTSLGADKFKKTVNEWFVFIAQLKEIEEKHTYRDGSEYSTYEFLASPNLDLVKAFVWMCVHFHDKSTLFNIANLADRCFKKIPGQGPTAASLGNACLYTLANSKGLDGISHLSRLKLRVKQTSTQTAIEKYLTVAAEKHKVSVHEIEDMAVDDYGFAEGKRIYSFEDYNAEITIAGIGKTTTQWIKPDGSLQKSIPAFVTERHAAKLKKLKETVKQVELQLTAQRDRIDRMLKVERRFSKEQIYELYLHHGVLGYLAKNIIWDLLTPAGRTSLFYLNNQWVNSNNEVVVQELPDHAVITLWHPVFHTIEVVKSWREFMITHSITQPLKQAFREVYFLTDAEVNTRTYSNRMAAHILKQHQFNSLAKTRGWKYALMGAFDNGMDNGTASIVLKDYDLVGEFWVNEVNDDNAMNDTGIWSYVSTDQVRFVRISTGQQLELLEIPALVFSEILRDVDLFVGVASVGNDPMWSDNGGLPAYRDYWQSYSFGDLNQVAKSRKEILERLVPRLKIAPVASIKDKFLVVKGKLRTYKIHIGSTNILMEPNDQYLCIVPDRSAKQTPENMFIPFEGDNGLSVIISKAFLLADDDKIKDSTITSQINRR